MPLFRPFPSLVVAALLSAAPAIAQTLLADIHPTGAPDTSGSRPRGFTALNGRTLFVAHGSGLGDELWISDGTGPGTQLVIDLYPGSFGAFSTYVSIAELGSVAVFLAQTDRGEGLWRTDGTATGTVLLRSFEDAGIRGLANMAGDGTTAWFVADDGIHGRELWRTDGTETGTYMVLDAAPGTASGAVLTGRSPITILSNGVGFIGADAAHGREPWVSDGTPAGTHLLADLRPGPDDSDPRNFYELPSGLYVNGLRDPFERVWFRQDPVTGLAVDLGAPPVAGDSAVLGDRIVYVGTESTTGIEPWSLDGATGQATLLGDLTAGSTGSLSSGFVRFGNEVWFAAVFRDPGGASLGSEPWITDGTPQGTRLFADLAPGHWSSSPRGFTPLGNSLVFRANGANDGSEPWISDGTPAGTHRITDIAPGIAASESIDITVIGNRAWFSANDQLHGAEPWITDGTEAGTRMVQDLADDQGSSDPRNATVLPLGTIFRASQPDNETWAWITDGTPAGTRRWATGWQAVATSTPAAVALGNRGFTNYDGILWAHDLAGAGRVEVDSAGGISREMVATPDGRLFFTDGQRLVTSDGTPGGKRVVRNFPNTPQIDRFQVNDAGLVFFSAYDSSTLDAGVWVSDGTNAGTRHLIAASSAQPSGVLDLLAVGDTVFAAVIASQDISEIWSTNGSVTTRLAEIPFDSRYGFDFGFAVAGDAGVLFAAGHGSAAGVELWRTDGTPAGTAMLADLNAGPASSTPRELTTAGDAVFFSAEDGVNGRRLWLSDGTAAGTRLASSASPAPFHTNPVGLLAVGDGRHVAFTAYTREEGYEPWRSDGTTAGTGMVAPLRPGPAGSGAGYPFLAGDHVVFVADDGVHGREPWAIPMRAFGAYRVSVFGGGCAGQGAVRPTLQSSGTPRLGDASFAIGLADARPNRNAALLFASESTLRTLGEDCVLSASPSVVGVAVRVNAAGRASLPLAVPTDPALAGVSFTTQWIVSDPDGSLGGVLSASPAARVTIGE